MLIIGALIPTSYKPDPGKRAIGEEGARFTSMRRLGGCLASIEIRRSHPELGPPGPWYVHDVCNTHNHVLASDARLLSAKLGEDEVEEVMGKRAAGVSSRSIADLLQTRHDGLVTAHAISNAFRKAKESYKGGLSDTQVMLDQLDTAGIPYKVGQSY